MTTKKDERLKNMNATTKQMLKNKKKDTIMNCLLNIKEELWEKGVFLESVQEWLFLAESLDADNAGNDKKCEVLSLWKYLIEMLNTISLYSSEELLKSHENIKEIIKTMNGLASSTAGIFYLASIININQESPFKNKLDYLISEQKKAYARLSIA